MSGTQQGAPTASMTVASGQAGVSPVGFGYYPNEGPRCVSAQYNWTSQAGFTEDLSGLVGRGVATTIQSVFIDNSGNSQPVTLTVNGTLQTLVVAGHSQGMFPLFFTGQPGFQLTTTAPIAAVTRLNLLNVPSNGASWGTV